MAGCLRFEDKKQHYAHVVAASLGREQSGRPVVVVVAVAVVLANAERIAMHYGAACTSRLRPTDLLPMPFSQPV